MEKRFSENPEEKEKRLVRIWESARKRRTEAANHADLGARRVARRKAAAMKKLYESHEKQTTAAEQCGKLLEEVE